MSYPLGIQEQETSIQQPISSGNTFDIKKIAYKVVGVLPWIIIGLFLATIAVKLYLRYTPTENKIAAYLLIKKEDEANVDYKVLKELGVVQSVNDILNQIDILKSYTLLERVVDSLKLNIHIRQQGRVTKSQLYGDDVPFTFKITQANEKFSPHSYQLHLSRDGYSINGFDVNKTFKWGDTLDIEYGKLVLERNPQVKISSEPYLLDFNTKHNEAGDLRGSLKVELTNDKGGGIVEISMQDQLVDRAIEILNTLITTFNNADLADKNVVTFKTVEFLSARIDSVNKELQKIESAAEEFKKNNRITDISIQGGIFQNQAMNIDGQRVKEYTQYKVLEALESYMSNFKGTNEIIPSSMGISEQALISLILQHNNLVAEKQNLEKISASSDPHLLDKTKQIFDIRENILRNIRILKKAFAQTVADLETNYNSLESRIGSLPEKERILLSLKRLASVKEELYVYLLKKKEETQLLLASSINNTRVIDYATDLGPVKPNKSQIKLLAYLIGIVIPAGIFILKDFLNNKIVAKNEIETIPVPIVGELSSLKRKKSYLVDIKSKNPIAEQFRLLRTNLYFAAPNKQVKTIMVSSFMSGEGKSFVSLNLANALSVTGAKTIILEFDLRNPNFSKAIHVNNDAGLSNYLSSYEVSLQDVLQNVEEMNNTAIITAGTIPPNPAELLLNNRTTDLFNNLKTNYDYIIIDTAPVGLVTDALLLEKYTDLTLFVIRHKFTLKAILPYIEKMSLDKKFRQMGLVVNGIKKDGSYGFSFGFGYSYSKYISEKKKNLLARFTSLFKA